MVMILRDVAFANDGTRGWDLDARCTEPPAPPALEWEQECAPTRAGGDPVEDLPSCRDDAWASEVAATFAPLGAGLEAALGASMADGIGPWIVRVTGWSGAEVDPLVTVELAPAAFGVPSGGVRGDLLRWDGNDAFHPFAAFVEADGTAVLVDEAAYVTDATLVARFPDDAWFPMRGRDRSLTLHLNDALLTIEMPLDGTRRATLSGRWPIPDALAQLGPAGLCAGDPLRTAAEIRVRDSGDVRATARGGAGMTAPCEALSVSLGFAIAPGLFGDVLEPDTPPPSPCPPEP